MNDLRSTIQAKPDCLTNRERLTGILMDCGLEKRTVQVMLNLHSCGVVEKIRQCDGVLSQTEIYNLTVEQESLYGTSRKFIEDGIRVWAEALGVKTSPFSSTPKPEPKKTSQSLGGFCGSNHLDANNKYSNDDLGNGENVTWCYDGKGTLTISGKGQMAKYSSETRPWNSVIEEIIIVKIECGITVIGEDAFKGCINLRKLMLSEGLRDIRSGAFLGCMQLENVKFPNSLEDIGYSAFYKCGLREAVLPWTCDGKLAFDNTTVVTHSDADLPPVSGSCGANAFWQCDGRGNLSVSGKGAMTDYSVGDEDEAPWCHFNGKILRVNIGRGITRIGDNAFYRTRITDILLPDTVQEIGNHAFFSTQLSKIALPEGLKIIDSMAFAYTNLSEITFPNSLERIGAYAFASFSNTKLQAVRVNRNCQVHPNAFPASTTVTYVDKADKCRGGKNEKTKKTAQPSRQTVRHNKDEKIELAFGWVSIILCISYFCALCPLPPYTFAAIAACLLVLTALMQYRLLKGGFNRLFQNEKLNGIYESLGQVFMWIFGIIMGLAAMGALGCINSDEPMPYQVTVACIAVAVVAWYHARWHFGYSFPSRKNSGSR